MLTICLWVCVCIYIYLLIFSFCSCLFYLQRVALVVSCCKLITIKIFIDMRCEEHFILKTCLVVRDVSSSNIWLPVLRLKMNDVLLALFNKYDFYFHGIKKKKE